MLALILIMVFSFFMLVLPLVIIILIGKGLKGNYSNKIKEDAIYANALKKQWQKISNSQENEESHEDNCEGSVIRERLVKDWKTEEENIEEIDVEDENNGGIEGIFEGLSDEEILVVASEILQPKY